MSTGEIVFWGGIVVVFLYSLFWLMQLVPIMIAAVVFFVVVLGVSLPVVGDFRPWKYREVLKEVCVRKAQTPGTVRPRRIQVAREGIVFRCDRGGPEHTVRWKKALGGPRED